MLFLLTINRSYYGNKGYFNIQLQRNLAQPIQSTKVTFDLLNAYCVLRIERKISE